jgi:hypothetical protein
MANFTVQTVNYRDFVGMLAAQKNEARRVWGETSVFLPGRTDIRYPNLSGTQWLKLKNFWEEPFTQVNKRVNNDEAFNALLFGVAAPLLTSAGRIAWKREYPAWQSETGWINTALANAYGNSILPESLAVSFWKSTEQLVLRSGGIFLAPRAYTMFGEAVAEAAHDVAQAIVKAPFKAAWWLLPSVPTWMKWAGIGLGAFYVTHLVTRRRD